VSLVVVPWVDLLGYLHSHVKQELLKVSDEALLLSIGNGAFSSRKEGGIMTDDQIERLILREIKKRGITFFDMIGLPNTGIDLHPEDKTTPLCEKDIRLNRFQAVMGCDRLKEILCKGQYRAYDPYPPLRVPFQDLFRFWWNRCVQREEIADEVLEDIFEYFTSIMQPPTKEEPQMDLTLDFDEMPLFGAGQQDAGDVMVRESIEESTSQLERSGG
jgi:hypothetical protein